jgi:uncharacterized RDD family membrane protein YckC/tetratricopeptide (TPR) repeat protein
MGAGYQHMFTGKERPDQQLKGKTETKLTSSEDPESHRYLLDAIEKDSSLSAQLVEAPQPGEIRFAGLTVRAFALLIDQVIFTIVFLLPALMLLATAFTPVTPLMITSGILVVCALLFSYVMQTWLYPAWFEASSLGGTPGKFLLGLRVVNKKFERLTFKQASIRMTVQFFIMSVGTIIFGLLFGVLTVLVNRSFSAFSTNSELLVVALCMCCVLFNKRKQTLIDLVTGRYVIHAPTSNLAPDWNDTNGHPIQKFVQRLKLCASKTWSELPRKALAIPVGLWTVTVVAVIATNSISIGTLFYKVHQIDERVPVTASSNELLQTLQELKIEPVEAYEDYKTVYIFLDFLRKKADPRYKAAVLTRLLKFDPDSTYYQEEKMKLDAIQNGSEAAKKAYLERAKSEDSDYGTKATCLASAATYCSSPAETRALLTKAISYAPWDRGIALQKIDADVAARDKLAVSKDKKLEAAVPKKLVLLDFSLMIPPESLSAQSAYAQNILQVYPQNTAALITMALNSNEKGDQSKTRAFWDRAVNVDPSDATPFALRAEFYSDDASWDDRTSSHVDLNDALASINKAIALRQNPAYFLTRHRIYDAKGNIAGAKADLEKACTLKPTLPTLAKFARFLSEHGDQKKAEQIARQAYKLIAEDSCTRRKFAGGSQLQFKYTEAGQAVGDLVAVQENGDDKDGEKTLTAALDTVLTKAQRNELMKSIAQAASER